MRVLAILRAARQVALAALLACVVAGCSAFSSSLDSVRYPAHLRYPQRKDLLVKDKPGIEVRKLDSPGELDESIRRVQDASQAKMFDPAKLDRDDAGTLNKALRGMFGTPREPQIGPGQDEREAFNKAWLFRWMKELQFTQVGEVSRLIAPGGENGEQVLQRGSALYRRHCLHCHGLAGDGRGPTGPWVHPHPRDYRRGQFKFISTSTNVPNRKPRRADLLRLLRQGIDGTSMPSFGLLPDYELEYLASYVIHLSIRGQVEFETMLRLLEGGKEKLEAPFSDTPLSIDDYVKSTTAQLLVAWAQSNAEKSLEGPAYTEPKDRAEREASIRRGYQMFISNKAQCVACHADYGRQVPYKYDVWGTLVRPANLTVSTYRGGRRPVDIFRRIRGGIEPSGMPAFTPEKPEDYWHLVNFVRALPYPAMLPEDVRQAVYGNPSAEKKPKGSQGG
jgi:mono/diheme cytochrome c family protein